MKTVDTATSVVVTLCRHGRPVGARVNTEDEQAVQWTKEELHAIWSGAIPDGRVEVWKRGTPIEFCDECKFGSAA